MSNSPFPYFPQLTEAEVGPEQTGVVSFDARPAFAFVYIKDDTGGQRAAARKFTDPTVFDLLQVGTRVRFRADIRFSRIVELSLAP